MNIIDSLYEAGCDHVLYLIKNHEISYLTEYENLFRKSLLLAIASYFEEIVVEQILNYCHGCSGGDDILINFIKNKAISRQYHTYFGWKKGEVNPFFSLFGQDVKEKYMSDVKGDENLKKASTSFMLLGETRNRLVHQNYCKFQLEMTAREIYDHYKQAVVFVRYIEKLFQRGT